ncbi:MAG: hypothetical protein Q9159_004401 [Coniocarpon cinnabarinum]
MLGKIFPSASSRSRSRQMAQPEVLVDLTSMKDLLKKRRVLNIDGQWWIPLKEVQAFMTRERIDRILQLVKPRRVYSDSDQDRLASQSLTEEIQSTLFHKLVFTILVDLDLSEWITRFILPKSRDHLPLSQKYFDQGMFKEIPQREVNRILKHQHHFIENDLSLGSLYPKFYPDHAILPLRGLGDDTSRQGSFGDVRKFQYKMPNEASEGHYVRKRFHPTSTAPQDYLIELRNLMVLSSANHPHILKPKAAYVHRDELNLVFPLADGDDLERVLHGTGSWELIDHLGHSNSKTINPFPWTVEDAEFVFALEGLVSAIATLHTLQTDSVKMIGCHRDLKPANILIHEGSLILADLGLSRIRKGESTSDTSQPEIMPKNYQAPECYHLQTFTPERARRSSDVWALGCIFLKVLMYRQNGQNALVLFENDLSREYGSVTFGCFFQENGREKILNPTVHGILKRMTDSDSRTSCSYRISLIVEQMLSLEQTSRPSAEVVSCQLQRLTISLWCELIQEELVKIYKQRGTMNAYWECLRFQGWKYVVELESLPSRTGPSTTRKDMPIEDFESLVEQLRGLRRLASPKNGKSRNHDVKLQPLRLRIDQLMSHLSDAQASQARDHAERELLANNIEDDLDKLYAAVAREAQPRAGWREESQRDALTQQMISLRLKGLQQSRKGTKREFQSFIEWENMEELSRSDNLIECELPNPVGTGNVFGLAEEMVLERLDNLDTRMSLYKRLTRLENIAKQLKQAAAMGNMRVLSCIDPGLFFSSASLQRESNQGSKSLTRLGLVYQFPRNNQADFRHWTTLESMLSEGEGKTRMRFDDKFQLAETLASTLYHLHTLSWLHRRISAMNVVLFHNQSQRDQKKVHVQNFFLVGFAGSRADVQDYDTDGSGTNRSYYQHHAYRTRSEDFKIAFDHYALGLLLLEIGCSELYPVICQRLQVSALTPPTDNAVMEELEYVMGSAYRGIVETCLESGGHKVSTYGFNEHMSILTDFKICVVDRLRGCCTALS